MWVKDLLLGLYEIYKKNNASKAQKKAREVARQEVEERLLSSGVLIEFLDRLERFEIMYLDHLADLHKKPTYSSDEGEDNRPPPPPPYVEETEDSTPAAPAPQAPLSIQARQLQILDALRNRGD